MNAFQSIAATQNSTLAVVAPGIAEALFATAIGLFAAIPAVIFFNKFNNHAGLIAERVDEFADEFASVIARELDKG
jgi:biopolymer transport protein TolQ